MRHLRLGGCAHDDAGGVEESLQRVESAHQLGDRRSLYVALFIALARPALNVELNQLPDQPVRQTTGLLRGLDVRGTGVLVGVVRRGHAQEIGLLARGRLGAQLLNTRTDAFVAVRVLGRPLHLVDDMGVSLEPFHQR
ncbi:hypothetical protein D9M72_337840 [compost metagenome]